MKKIKFFLLIAFVVFGGGAFFAFTQNAPNMMQIDERASVESDVPQEMEQQEETYRQFSSADITGAASAFKFSAEIPVGWEVEAVEAIEALNIYDPAAVGATNLEKSQIFIRHFTADRFLTLQTVTIHERDELQINDRDAVRYVIERKAGVANFPSQPLWRNDLHTVNDIRVSNASPSIFYVVAQNPELDVAVYELFLQSIEPGNSI